MRRRVNKNASATIMGHAKQRNSPRESSSPKSTARMSLHLLATSVFAVLCPILLMLSYLALPFISRESTKNTGTTKEDHSLRRQTKDAKLDVNEPQYSFSKPTVALPNVLLIEAGTSAVRTDAWLIYRIKVYPSFTFFDLSMYFHFPQYRSLIGYTKVVHATQKYSMTNQVTMTNRLNSMIKMKDTIRALISIKSVLNIA